MSEPKQDPQTQTQTQPQPQEPDEVVSETPVFLHKPQQEHIVLQYPTRRINTKDRNTVALRVKPNTHVVEAKVESGLDETKQNPDKVSVWGEGKYQIYEGVLRQPLASYLLAHTDEEGALHLTRIERVAQLRPQFAHFDRAVQEDIDHARQQLRDQAKPVGAAAAKAVQISARQSSENSMFSPALKFWRDASNENFRDYNVVRGVVKEEA